MGVEDEVGMRASCKGAKKNPAAAREWRRRVGVVDCVPEWDEKTHLLDSAADGCRSEDRSVLELRIREDPQASNLEM